VRIDSGRFNSVRERRLLRGSVAIPLRLNVFDTLRGLVENDGRWSRSARDHEHRASPAL
jgi:hypothetical protein